MRAEWNPNFKAETSGVIVGCAQNQEWLLPWWWMNLCLHNLYPVCFINFGNMSPAAQAWCKKRGQFITLEGIEQFIKGKEGVEPAKAAHWEEQYGKDIWLKRTSWFKKPFALLQTPFEKAVWLDVDCQVKGSLEPLFNAYLSTADVAMAEDLFLQKSNLDPDYTIYNAGVIAYHRGSKLILEWAGLSTEQNHLFRGDQAMLCKLISSNRFSFTSLPDVFNWPAAYGVDRNVIIMHWWSNTGKELIREKIANLKKNHSIDLFLED